MAERRTNLALAWCSLLAVLTGLGAFIVGTQAGTWVDSVEIDRRPPWWQPLPVV